MSARRRFALWVGGLSLALLACGEDGTATPASSDATAAGARAARMSDDERRVYLFVLPADATVFVDDADRPAERRDGVIELTGRPKQAHRVEVFRGGLMTTVQ